MCDFRGRRFNPTAETRSSTYSVPVNNIVDNLNITAGKHNVQLGVNWRLIHQNRVPRDSNSFSSRATPTIEWFNKGPGGPDGIGLDAVFPTRRTTTTTIRTSPVLFPFVSQPVQLHS